MAGAKKDLGELQKRIDYYWCDQALLRRAFVHSSYLYENRDRDRLVQSNERLEFLGDAVLELIISDYYFNSYPGKTEGELTKMRALTVCESSLAAVARSLGLGQYMWMGRGEERSGGRHRPSILADAFEALLGAIYLDAGLEEAQRVALTAMAKIMQQVQAGQAKRDFKTELQELLQQKTTDPVCYAIIAEEGPDHDKTFTAVVECQGHRMGTGRGRSKKEAEQQAAKMALESFLDVD